ncbi:MAG: hypothetical protein ACI4VF_03645 [Lachnospirales bacterium]
MRYARPRRHYRVAKQQIDQSPLRGTYISNKSKPKIYAAGGVIGLLIFLLGLLLGVLIDRD